MKTISLKQHCFGWNIQFLAKNTRVSKKRQHHCFMHWRKRVTITFRKYLTMLWQLKSDQIKTCLILVHLGYGTYLGWSGQHMPPKSPISQQDGYSWSMFSQTVGTNHVVRCLFWQEPSYHGCMGSKSQSDRSDRFHTGTSIQISSTDRWMGGNSENQEYFPQIGFGEMLTCCKVFCKKMLGTVIFISKMIVVRKTDIY